MIRLRTSGLLQRSQDGVEGDRRRAPDFHPRRRVRIHRFRPSEPRITTANNSNANGFDSHPRAGALFGVGYLPLPIPFYRYLRQGRRRSTANRRHDHHFEAVRQARIACVPPTYSRHSETDNKFAYGAGRAVQGVGLRISRRVRTDQLAVRRPGRPDGQRDLDVLRTADTGRFVNDTPHPVRSPSGRTYCAHDHTAPLQHSLTRAPLLRSACALHARNLAGAAGVSDATTRALRSKVDTIVVIYAENRAFDNLYGNFPGARGPQRGRGS